MTELERIDKLVRVIAENNQQITALKKENNELRARLNERSGVPQDEQLACARRLGERVAEAIIRKAASD